MENNNSNDASWKEIEIPVELVGELITKGDGYYKKEYRYINIPVGYGYDGYVFLISENLVVNGSYLEQAYCYIKICDNMTFELFYAPNLREEGKRYKRWKLTASELFTQIIEPYKDVLFRKELLQRKRKKQRKISKINPFSGP